MTPGDPAFPIGHPGGGLPSAVGWSHLLIEGRLRLGDIAIDATSGNGHDTLFLARRVVPGGHVYAFDVQAQALEQTRLRLGEAGIPEDGCTLLHCSHDQMTGRIPAHLHGQVRVIMFNLGYLPGSDKCLTTQKAATLSAISQGLQILANGGLMTVVVYPGHAEGMEEARAMEVFASELPSRAFEVQHLRPVNPTAAPPECWAIWKR